MKKKLAIILITAMTVAGMTTGCGNKLTLSDDSFTLELGDSPENHTASYVDVKDEKELNKISFDFSKVDTMKVGEYKATASIGSTKKTFHIEVEDTTAPKAAAKAENQNRCEHAGLCRRYDRFDHRTKRQGQRYI